MGKIVYGLVLALVAIQGIQSDVIHKHPRNVIDDVGKELREIIQEVNEKIVEISKELAEKLEEFKTEANFNKIISDLREEIYKVDQSEKKCVTAAKDKTSALEFILKNNLFSCKIQADESSKDLSEKLVAVLKNLKNLAKEVTEVFYTCMKDSNNNHDKFEECLAKKAEDITEKLETFKISVDEALAAVEGSKQKVIDDLKVCVDNVKEESEKKASVILEELNKCIEGDKLKTDIKSKNLFYGHGIQSDFMNKHPRNVIDDVGKELREIVQEVNKKISEIYKELAEKLEEFKNEANFNKIITDLREEISKVDQDEKKCVTAAKDKTSALEFILKHNLFSCKIQADESSKDLSEKLVAVLKNLKNLAKEVTDVFYTCMKDSNNNHDKFEECLAKKAEDITQKLETFKLSVEEALAAVEGSKQKVIDDLKVCVDNVKEESEKKASVILEELNKCIEGDKLKTDIKSKNLFYGHGIQSDFMNSQPRNVIDDVGKELREIIQEVNKKISEIYKELAEKLEEFKNEANFNKIIIDLREEISRVDQDEKKCVTAAKDKTSALEFILKHNLFSCKIQADESSKDLSEKLVAVLKNLKNLAKEVTEVFYTCMKDSNNNHDKFEECLAKKAEDITEKLETFKISVDEALAAVDGSKQKVIDDLKVCVDNVKEESEKKASVILEELNKCIEGDKLKTDIKSKNLFYGHGIQSDFMNKQPRNVIDDVGKELREIIQEVNKKISEIYKELAQKLEEFKNEANFNKIIIDLREEISRVDQDEKKCVTAAKDKTSALEFILKHNLFSCKIQADESSKDLSEKLVAVLKNLKNLAKEVTDVFYTCMKDSNNNHDKFEECLAKKAEDITEKLETFKISVDEALAAVDGSKQKIIDDLKVCVDNVKEESENKASVILEDLNKCIEGADI